MKVASQAEGHLPVHATFNFRELLPVHLGIEGPPRIRMRRANDVRDAIRCCHLDHGNRRLNLRWPVIEAEQQMVMNINHDFCWPEAEPIVTVIKLMANG